MNVPNRNQSPDSNCRGILKMKDEEFELLKESIKQAGEIKKEFSRIKVHSMKLIQLTVRLGMTGKIRGRCASFISIAVHGNISE